MVIASAVILGAGILAAWTLLYHMAFVLKRMDRKHVLGTITALVLAITPLTTVLYFGMQQDRAMDQAQRSFATEYPGGQLLLVEELADVWIYSYLESTEQRTSLRIGETWLSINSQE